MLLRKPLDTGHRRDGATGMTKKRDSMASVVLKRHEMKRRVKKGENLGKGAYDPLKEARDMVRACIQCGTCSGSCPNAFAMDYQPRALWLLIQRGDAGAVFDSRTFSLCSACYSCTLRCPRGLRLTEVMAALKQAAVRLRPKKFRPGMAFYENFLDSVRRHGRVNETEFMFTYFLDRKNPLLPLQFASLGLKFMKKGKMKIAVPGLGGSGTLDPIFQKVEELEGQ